MKTTKQRRAEMSSEEKLEEQMEQFRSVGIESTGTKIVLPEGMDLTTGIEWLKRHRQELEEEVGISERIEAYPLDAALALSKVLQRKFGWAHMKSVDMGFFGKRPPSMVGIATGIDTSEQVPWGRMEIPGIEGYIETNISRGEGGMPVMILGGIVRRKNEKEVHEIAEQVRKVVREESIYRGKAIRIEFPDDGDDFDPSQAPKFLDVSQVKPEELVFSADLDRLIRTALFVPIEKTEVCRRHQIPLKRGILLEGPFGTGKTLTAWVTARKAQESGWTFLYLSSVSDLSKAVLFAKQYAPCVIFAEDIDSIGKDRTTMVNRLLNVIDGVESKSSELIVVLTTNAVTEINQALLRPGRLDAVVSVRAPDAGAVERLIRLYSRDLLRKDEDLSEVTQEMAGQIPAFIREVVERAKLAAIGRLASDEALSITADDLEIAASGMLNHLKLLAPQLPDERSPAEKAADILATAMRDTSNGRNGVDHASDKPTTNRPIVQVLTE